MSNVTYEEFFHALEDINAFFAKKKDIPKEVLSIIEDYLLKNPLNSDAVKYVVQNLTNEQRLQARTNIGAISQDGINEAVNDALTQAKETGEFDGTSVNITSVVESTEDGGENVITFSDGTIVRIRNGNQGSDGNNGDGGTTITSIQQTTTSIEDGGTNVITVTLSNGQKATFDVRNGSKGSNGKGITSTTLNSDYTLTLTFTDGTSYTTPSIRGAKGDTGDPYTLTSSDKTAIATEAAGMVDTSSLLPKSGGTMTGVLTAQNNTSYTTKQVRNVIYLEDGASVPTTSNGDLVLFYK